MSVCWNESVYVCGDGNVGECDGGYGTGYVIGSESGRDEFALLLTLVEMQKTMECSKSDWRWEWLESLMISELKRLVI